MEHEYTAKTQELIASKTLTERKEHGQYMTPLRIGMKMAGLFSRFQEDERILDPAVGTGELLRAVQIKLKSSAQKSASTIQFHGWDIDQSMLDTFKDNVSIGFDKRRSIFDPILPKDIGAYDKIIANPPYFEIKKNDPRLTDCWLSTTKEKGRLNIYALFFEYALTLLKPGGELVFLVPPSMNNGAYFSMTRRFILENSRIDHIEVIRANNEFDDALTSIQIIKLTKTNNGFAKNLADSKKYVHSFGDELPTIFSDKKQDLIRPWKKRDSLDALGYMVITGRTPWNQHKNSFQQFNQDKINHHDLAPLLYSKDITSEHETVLSDKLSDRRYLPISTPGSFSSSSIIVNRIVGSLNNPKLRYALVDDKEFPVYFAENHVNVIIPIPGKVPKITLSELCDRLDKAQIYLPSYLQALTGNTQLSATELRYLIPV